MTEHDIADYPQLVGHEYNWICAICLCPAQAGVWLEFLFIEFPHHPLIFDINRRHGHTVSEVAINFTLSVSPRSTQKQNFGCLGHIDVVQATDLQN